MARLLLATLLFLWSTPALAVGPVGGGGAPGWTQIYGIQPRPTMYYLPYHADASSSAGAQTWTRFLIDDLPGIDGPGWDLLECRITLGGAGRLVPTDSHDIDSLPGAAVALATNDDWCVLRALTGDGGTRWVLYVELQSAAAIYVGVCPLDNWVTGGADLSPPPWMAGCFAAGDLNLGGGLILFTTGNGNYSAMADTSMVQLLVDIGGTLGWGYYGELDGCRSDGTPSDDSCYVAWDTPQIQQANYIGASYFNRLSPVDDSTVLIIGGPAVLLANSLSIVSTTVDTAMLGVWTDIPIWVHFSDAGSRHIAGKLRGMTATNFDVGALSQTTDNCHLIVGTGVNTNGRFVLPWDCTTAYPGAAAVTFTHGGWKAVPADWIVPEGGGL